MLNTVVLARVVVSLAMRVCGRRGPCAYAALPGCHCEVATLSIVAQSFTATVSAWLCVGRAGVCVQVIIGGVGVFPTRDPGRWRCVGASRRSCALAACLGLHGVVFRLCGVALFCRGRCAVAAADPGLQCFWYSALELTTVEVASQNVLKSQDLQGTESYKNSKS
mgnify:CR=1 FL=1